MEQSGIAGFKPQVNTEEVADIRDASFCTQFVFAEMVGLKDTSLDMVRGWVETQAIPTLKIGRRRVVNLHRIRRDIERDKTEFRAGDDGSEQARDGALPGNAARRRTYPQTS